VATAIFRSDVRFFGAGVIGVAALWTFARILGPIVAGLRSAMHASAARNDAGHVLPFADRDLPIGIVGSVVAAARCHTSRSAARGVPSAAMINATARCASRRSPGVASCRAVVQLDGAMSTAAYQTGTEFILGRCADMLRANTIRLPAPLYADPSTVASMRSDSLISRTLEAGRRADVMLFGVGAVSTSTTLFEGSFLDTRMLDELAALGAVGEIGGRFFDADGVPVDPELQQRAVSVPLEDVRSCKKTILISSGAAKHHATLGALRGKLGRLLVCDIDCARWLLAQ